MMTDSIKAEPERFVIDTRPQAVEPKRLTADLYIRIQRHGADRYTVAYIAGEDCHLTEKHFVTRAEMVQEHVAAIQRYKPKTVVVNDREADGVAIHPGVVKMIVEGKLSALELTLK